MFIFNLEYALQMPSSFVDIDRDEMEYVDGGAIGTNGLSFYWWGMAVKLSGTVLKKIFNYSWDGIAAGAGGVIAAALGCSAIVAATIGLAIAVSITVIKYIHNGYHGVSFNRSYSSAWVVPWRQ